MVCGAIQVIIINQNQNSLHVIGTTKLKFNPDGVIHPFNILNI